MNDILSFINNLDLDETAVKKSISFATRSTARTGVTIDQSSRKGIKRPDVAANMLGKKRPASVREKLRVAHLGTKLHESTKEKMAASRQKFLAEKRAVLHAELSPKYWHALRHPVTSVLSGAVKVKPTMDAHSIHIPTFSVWMHETMRITLDDLVKLANECETGEIFRDTLSPRLD